MKRSRLFCLLTFITACSVSTYASYRDLSPPEIMRLKTYSWHQGCPVAISDLRYLQVPYWGVDQRQHHGAIIVHQKVAMELDRLFERFYQGHIVFESIKPIDVYQGNDHRSMSHNNTSAFNCRAMTGATQTFSKHALGMAIDINPRWNPYQKGSLTLPANAMSYDAEHCHLYQNCQQSLLVRWFKEAGWTWGGDWHSLKDFQHFEK